MSSSRLTVVTPPKNEARAVEVARAIRGLRPYRAVSSLQAIEAKPDQTPHKLDWNEATVPPSPRVIEAITRFLGNAHHLNWYPVLNSTNLIARLARFYEIPEDHLIVTNGSDEALDVVCTTYLDDGDTVLVPAPTYTHFLVFAQAAGGRIAYHHGNDPFESDFEGLLSALARVRPRLLYLVNPNNPTGVTYTSEEIGALLEAAPETLVVVDEAYSEFAGVTCMDLVDVYRNLIVTRTFSKAYGIAGLRIGYAISQPGAIADLRRVANPKAVNVLGQIAAMAAIDDQAYLHAFLDQVTRSKALMAEWFAARGLACRVTSGNYVMVRFEQAPWVVQMLAEEGVYVRDRSSIEQLGGFVRFTVGTVDQTYEVLDRVDRVLERRWPSRA